MSQHPPERITPLPDVKLIFSVEEMTPLPWKFVEETDPDGYAGTYTIEGADGKFMMNDMPYYPHAMKTEDAKYAVHCANNYPKLEALNAELVKVAEDRLDSLMSLKNGYVYANLPCDPETIQKIAEVEAIISKAKGGA